MLEDARRIFNAIANVITRGVIDRIDPDGAFAQVEGLSGHVTPEVEVFQPQGVHFKAPTGADVVLVSPTGDTGNAVAFAAARDSLPEDSLGSGEGGLHYLGEFKVFIAADGTVHLGQKDPTDFVALASKVDAALSAIVTYINGHTHPVATTGTATAQSGTASAPVSPLASQAPVGSVIVKAR